MAVAAASVAEPAATAVAPNDSTGGGGGDGFDDALRHKLLAGYGLDTRLRAARILRPLSSRAANWLWLPADAQPDRALASWPTVHAASDVPTDAVTAEALHARLHAPRVPPPRPPMRRVVQAHDDGDDLRRAFQGLLRFVDHGYAMPVTENGSAGGEPRALWSAPPTHDVLLCCLMPLFLLPVQPESSSASASNTTGGDNAHRSVAATEGVGHPLSLNAALGVGGDFSMTPLQLAIHRCPPVAVALVALPAPHPFALDVSAAPDGGHRAALYMCVGGMSVRAFSLAFVEQLLKRSDDRARNGTPGWLPLWEVLHRLGYALTDCIRGNEPPAASAAELEMACLTLHLFVQFAEVDGCGVDLFQCRDVFGATAEGRAARPLPWLQSQLDTATATVAAANAARQQQHAAAGAAATAPAPAADRNTATVVPAVAVAACRALQQRVEQVVAFRDDSWRSLCAAMRVAPSPSPSLSSAPAAVAAAGTAAAAAAAGVSADSAGPQLLPEVLCRVVHSYWVVLPSTQAPTSAAAADAVK